ncbi:MAG: YggS family pyridoxal phosphate-dependent enzyme [Gammaproteobacteria bacterium]
MTRNSIQNRVMSVVSRITEAELHYQRKKNSVKLLAVSKTQEITALEQAISAGLRHFGENYLQDALAKITYFANLADCPALEWHFIGPIQSNKTNKIANNFNWVHSVDRIAIAERLSRQRSNHLAALNICIQVNIDHAAQKAGIHASECLELAQQIKQLPGLKLRGLMAVPEPNTELTQQRQPFRQIFELFTALNKHGMDLDTLSMGMSSDLDAAIAEGSTMVRIGTDIFGPRKYAK